MGQMLVTCATGDPDLHVFAAVDTGDDFASTVPGADAIIDFSHHSAIEPVLARCMEHQKTLVIGTTGHTDAQIAAIKHASGQIPIVFAPNYSIGVNTLFWLTRKAAEILGPGFDLEVVEMHHRFKKDAPSGTAKRLVEILAEVRELSYNKDARHGRQGIVGERTNAEIGVHAIRGGDVVGDHTVIYAAQGERVELTHKASSRETFARGALRAALWAHDKPAGLYDMQDVLGLK
ncbi:Dihydrodipicolinate reductase [Chthoniobacter flavus Ellin428]|uniref:4-hydroxy-tetrahydrodipicolinate reductase n=2 Tax=Chthoniobacter flavus TaxID=191863 RepID=B4CW36_9BACT|nr:Dihydrodipicolinate reductase [Chthoniobacter flavus Ellin428]TCO95566.1 dihydrodipicolinate reductase [Chthoniobacter flavus]